MRTGSYKALKPVSMPRDARAIMKFDGALGDAIAAFCREAEADGRWERPQDIELNPRNPLSLAYWLHKSQYPITRSMGDLETGFMQFRRSHFYLLPENFEVESSLTMSACGDLMSTPGLDGARDRLYASVSDLIFGSDIVYANLESTLSNQPVGPTEFTAESTPKINLTMEQYQTLVAHQGRRFDVLQLANNHILDCGEEGVRTTLSQLARDGIAQVGVNDSAAGADAGQVTEHHGLRIGWVAHTFSVNFKPFPPGKPWRVNMTPFHLHPDPDLSCIERQIAACRIAGCDLVIVGLHWGLEFEFYPHPDQLKWARRIADLGADLIIGHHPHVAQFVEIYRMPSDPSRAVPILYSLGNLSTLLSHPAMVLSLVARLSIARGRYRARREVRISGLDLTPIGLVAEHEGACEIVRLVPLVDLLRCRPLDMADYVDEMASYADLLLDRSWRAPSAAI